MGNIVIRAAKVVIKVAESVPGVGHFVAFVHWLRGDRAAASGAMWSATRSTLVVAAGVAGMCLCGPTWAVVAAVGCGVTYDALRSLGNREALGTVGAVFDVSRDIAAWRFPLYSGVRLLFLLSADAALGRSTVAFVREVSNTVIAITSPAIDEMKTMASRVVWKEVSLTKCFGVLFDFSGTYTATQIDKVADSILLAVLPLAAKMVKAIACVVLLLIWKLLVSPLQLYSYFCRSFFEGKFFRESRCKMLVY